MLNLPARPHLDQLRHQARDLLRAARAGDASAARRIQAVSARLTLAAAQLVVARDYGFPSWARLKAEQIVPCAVQHPHQYGISCVVVELGNAPHFSH